MDQAEVRRPLHHENSSRELQPNRNSSTARLKRARSLSEDVQDEQKKSPNSVPRFSSSSSVQQALKTLLAHGIDPAELDLVRSQTVMREAKTGQSSQLYDHGQGFYPVQHRDTIPGREKTSQGLASSQIERNSSLPTKWVHPATSPANQAENSPVAKDGLMKRLRNDYETDIFTSHISEAYVKPAVVNTELENEETTLAFPSLPSDFHTPEEESGNPLPVFELRSPTRFDRYAEDRNTNHGPAQSSVTLESEIEVQSNSEDEDATSLCRLCSQSQTVVKLREKIAELQRQISGPIKIPQLPPPPKISVLHRVSCTCDQDERLFTARSPRLSVFLDRPYRVTENGRWHLQGDLNAPQEPVYLERNPAIALLVYKEYKCKDDKERFSWVGSFQNNIGQDGVEKPPSSCSESMLIKSTNLVEALVWATSDIEIAGIKKHFAINTEIKSPYHYFYHSRASLRQKLNQMDPEHRKAFLLLMEYVEESFEASYQEASSLFSQGLVSVETIRYLYEPDMHVICQQEDDTLAFRTSCWLEDSTAPRTPEEIGQLRCWSWAFDGSFRKRHRTFRLEWSGFRLELKAIKSLTVFPLQYADRAVEEHLFNRGEKFWDCRNRIYVSYDHEDLFGDLVQRGARYMIDVPMHLKSYPKNYQPHPQDEVVELDCLVMTSPRQFFLLLPSKVFGYSMSTKRWVPLKVRYISPVVWNTEAFDSLVVDTDTKELVQALVTNQLEKEKGTDLMEGKGNGLVILLHGGPGTGKTLTAESVAELARKPLYRVTCGDISLNTDGIEKTLPSVLHLGRVWGCVVLLDEADVFLEERRLEDMQRNALVSVFLRVLEYYDGILILTSNRVGTFDEAFKSRIQLALHYENLTRTQRRAIWANFIKRLSSIEKDSVNTDSLTEHLDELAAHDMNGRQIRNSLTTARQLALYKGKKMDYGLLKHAIGVGSKFDHYLKGVKGNFSDDELAREGGVR